MDVSHDPVNDFDDKVCALPSGFVKAPGPGFLRLSIPPVAVDEVGANRMPC